MERQQFYLPRSGKLVTQLPKGITFLYNLCLGHLKDCWKGPVEEYIDDSYHSSPPSNAPKNIV